MIVVLHESESGKLEDASVFGPFETHEEADGFIDWAQEEERGSLQCSGRDMVKLVLPVKVIRGFEYEF